MSGLEKEESTRVRDELSRGGASPASLTLEPVRCCICETEDAEPLATGEDFEYQTSADTFLAMRCRSCGLVYLNPRPSLADLDRIYPDNYHAFQFSEDHYGVVYKIRRRLEARRALSWCRELGDDARILDVGCGDGFHLGLLREFGRPGWTLEGVDNSDRAIAVAEEAGLVVHQGSIEDLDLPESSYDLAILVQTIEHVGNPPAVLSAIRRVLKPGGTVVVVTDNTSSLDFRIFKGRHWGGYHFPRHWNLFSPETMRALARKVGLEVQSFSTVVSPVNWVYSVRNTLVDLGAPAWLSNRFSLESPVSLSVFTVFDMLHQLAGRGALIRAILRRPA
jgi:SAM-dependent methyltransferase